MQQITQILFENDVNILGSVNNDSAEYGIVRMVVSDPDKAEQALQAAGYMTRQTDVLGVEVQAGFQIDVIFVMLRAVVGDERGDGAAAAAILHGLVDGLVGVQRDLADLRRERQRTIREHNSQRVGRGVLVDSLLYGVDGGVALQPADVDARNIDIRVNRILILEHETIRADAKHDDHNQRQCNDEPLISAAGRSLRRFRLLRRLTDLLFGHRRPLGRAALLKFSFLSDRNPSNLHRQNLPGIGNMSSQARKAEIMTTIIIPKHPSFCNGNSTKNTMQIMNLSLRFAIARAGFPSLLT